jgi:cytochrome c-type biogenesis protein CcmH
MIVSWQFVLMILLSSFFLALFLYRPIKKTISHDASNIAINKQKQEELKLDFDHGFIGETQYHEAQDEIVETLASDLNYQYSEEVSTIPFRWTIILVFCISVTSLLLYAQLKPTISSDDSQTMESPVNLIDSVNSLESYLVDNPNDFQAWKMLALAQFNLGEMKNSLESFESALGLNPNDVDLLLQYASVFAANQEGSFLGKPKLMIDKALDIDSQSIHALYLSGVVATNQGDIILAEKFWQKALYLMPSNHPDRNVLEDALFTISK